MPEMSDGRVTYGVTGWKELKDSGVLHADMHFHTNCSDSYTDANSMMKLARIRGTGIAVTDHNLIGTLRKIDLRDPDVMVIPGMEISTTDDPHVLVYFYEFGELEEFWEKYIHPRLAPCPWLALKDFTTCDLLDAAEGLNCVVSAAHPMGYFNSPKGVEICRVKGCISDETAKRLDAYEVICSGMSHKSNLKALDAARSLGLSYTGGTDGHLLFELGNVVTVCDANDRDGFLDEIAKGRSKVVGREKTPVEKVQMGSASFSKFVEHVTTSVTSKVMHNAGKVSKKRSQS
ncbi:MAG: PHP-associated domain-containing protein [Candidatus Methanomethylophilaceae archaeon]